MSLKKQALAGVFWSSIQQFGTQGISFIVSIILARLILPEEFGLIGMLGIFMGIARVLSDSGMTQSLIRSLDSTEKDYSTVFFYNFGISIIMYILIFILSPYIAIFYKQPILKNIIRLYCIIFIINPFSTIQNTILTKKMDFKSQLKTALPSLIISSIVGVVLAINNFGVWSLVWSAILQNLFLAIQLWFWSTWKPQFIFDKIIFKKHFHYGYKVLLSSLLDSVFTNIYTIIIGRYFSVLQVGYYTRADSFKQLPVSSLSNILNKVTFPLFVNIQNDNEKLKSVNKKIIKMVIFVISPVLIYLAFMAEPIFRLLFTSKWLPAVPYFQILCANGILYPVHSYNLNILKAKGKIDLFLKLEIVKKVLFAVAIAISIIFGIYGLLYGSVIFSILALFINSYFTGILINYKIIEQLFDILPTIFITIIVCLTTYFLDQLILVKYLNDFFRIGISLIYTVLIFLFIMKLLKNESLIELIKIIKIK